MDSSDGPTSTADPRRWSRIRSVTRWLPREGEELIGTYLGSTTLQGPHGEYTVQHVKQEGTGKVFAMHGASVNSVLSICVPGQTVKIVCTECTPFDMGDGLDRAKRVYEGFTCDVDV